MDRPTRSLRLRAALALVALGLAPLAALGSSGASTAAPTAAPQGDRFWTPSATRPRSTPTRKRSVTPNDYAAYTLDRRGLAATLAQAPRAGTIQARRAPLTVEVPAPDGTLIAFDVVETSVMESALAAAHPDIRTYAGAPADGSADTIRIDVSPFGFHASVLGVHGAWYVDPAYVADDSLYLSYDRAALPPSQAPVDPDTVRRFDGYTPPRGVEPQAANDIVALRTFRLALVTDPSYAAYVAPGLTGTASDNAVLAAKTTLINRVNQLYLADLGVQMTMVAGTDTELNLQNNTEMAAAGYDPAAVNNDGCSAALDQTTPALNGLIGSANYDIGHIGLGLNGGGVAYLGSVGDPDFKGGGCTGLPEPIGDFFAIDYVAHEMGHQFGGNHTFNGVSGSCGGGNRNGSTAVEPGSGSSVMAYAGICSSDDLQPHTDPYFSQRTITEVSAFLASIAGVGTTAPTANHAPSVTAPAAKSIPRLTPFTLTATGSDVDGDALVYLWEQNDTGLASSLVSNAKSGIPLFRVFGSYADVSPSAALEYHSPGENIATASSTRVFPDLDQILANATNAALGTCPTAATSAPLPDGPVLECYSEFLPNTPSTLRFRVTARDLDPIAGGTATGDVVLSVHATAGPFRVTSQSAATTYQGGTAQQVTWDVNGTDAATLAPQVRITLSSDGGQSFDHVLAANTPNDGSQSVTLPNLDIASARIRIEAVGNYFFDINDTAFAVQHNDALVPDTTLTGGPADDSLLLADDATFTLGSDQPGATFSCTLDGAVLPCAAGELALTRLDAGTHRLVATASLADVEDPTPATRSFTVAAGPADLATKGRWKVRRLSAAFDDKVLVSRQRGASLRYRATQVTRVGVIIRVTPRAGKVRLSFGDASKRVRTAGTNKRRIVWLPRLAAPRSGKVVVTVLTRGRVVRIEGIAAMP